MSRRVKIVAWSAAILLAFAWIGTSPLSSIQAEASQTEARAQTSEITALEATINEEEIMKIEITIKPSEWDELLENAAKESFVAADVSMNGVKYSNVGLRTKGNSSLTSVAGMDSDRYSFKLKFDEYVDGQTYNELKILNLNNQYSDATYLREYLSYKALESMGLPVPLMNFANIYINGELFGFYFAVENIGETYLQRNFGNTTGALYKPDGQGADLVYTTDHIDDYPGLNLKSDAGKDGKDILNMLYILNNSSSREALESVLNVDQILRYFAVNTALENADSYQGQMNHNYYLYLNNGKFELLPWDYNMSFGGMGGAGGPRAQAETQDKTETVDAVAQTNETSETISTDQTAQNQEATTANAANNQGNRVDMGGEQTSYSKIDEPVSGQMSERPLFSKLMVIPEYKALYHQYIKEVVTTGYLEPSSLAATIDELAVKIREEVIADPTKFYSVEEFESGIDQGAGQRAGLKKFAVEQQNNILGQLDGSITSVKDESDTNRSFGGRPNGFAGEQSTGLWASMVSDVQRVYALLSGKGITQRGFGGPPGDEAGFPGDFGDLGGSDMQNDLKNITQEQTTQRQDLQDPGGANAQNPATQAAENPMQNNMERGQMPGGRGMGQQIDTGKLAANLIFVALMIIFLPMITIIVLKKRRQNNMI